MTGIAFAAEVVTDTESVVETVFGRPVALRNERLGEATIPAGQIGLIANYRAFNTSGKGKRARGAGETVIDLSACARLPARELGAFIERLGELNDSLEAGVEQAEALAPAPTT